MKIAGLLCKHGFYAIWLFTTTHPEDAVFEHHDNRSGRKLFESIAAALAG